MSFALPFALLLGALVAGPFIAHFVRRAQTPQQMLPTIRLLQRAMADNQRKRRLDDPWLFLLRALFVLLAALAAAAPFVWVPLELGDGRAAAMAVVVDGSRSMLARDGTTPLVEVARDRASRALEGLPRGSERTLVFAGTPPVVLADRADSAEAVANAASRIDTSDAIYGDSLASAVALAVRRLHGSPLAVRRLVVFSDFARHVDVSSLEIPASIEVEFVRVAPRDHRNAAIALESVEVDPRDRAARILRASASAYALTAQSRVELDVRGRTTSSAPVTLGDSTAYAELRATTGDDHPDARLTLEVQDALPEDDHFEFRLRPPRETRVLFVDGEPSTNRFDDEVGLAARALELVPPGDRRFESSRVDPGALSDELLDRHDVVVLANIGSLPTATAANLVRRVRAGLGLLIAPGDRSDGRALSQSLAAILPARLGLHSACPERRGVVLREAPDSLIVSGLDGVIHRGCTDVDPQLGRSKTALVRNDGSPLLVLSTSEGGRVGVLGVALDPEGSDLPLRPGFLPLLSTLLGHLDGSSSRTPEFVEAGARVELGESGLSVRTPNGETRSAGRDGVYGPVDELGVHEVLRDGEPVAERSFTAIPSRLESDLRPADLPTGRRSGERGSAQTKLARDVSSPVFAGLGLLLLVEGVFRELQRGRRRAETTRSTPP